MPVGIGTDGRDIELIPSAFRVCEAKGRPELFSARNRASSVSDLTVAGFSGLRIGH